MPSQKMNVYRCLLVMKAASNLQLGISSQTSSTNYMFCRTSLINAKIKLILTEGSFKSRREADGQETPFCSS